MKRIEDLTGRGTNIFMSGSYVGSDLSAQRDSTAIKFAERYLHFLPRTGHAVKNGNVYSTDYVRSSFECKFDFNTDYSKDIYSVEAPDGIEPSGAGALCAFRYGETNASAGVIYKGTHRTVILGFPFETITGSENRNSLMKQILNFFEK